MNNNYFLHNYVNRFFYFEKDDITNTVLHENIVDFVEDLGNGVKLLIDSMSYQYIDGSTLKYKKEMMSEQFVIDNPNATRTCGCGSSFGV